MVILDDGPVNDRKCMSVHSNDWGNLPVRDDADLLFEQSLSKKGRVQAGDAAKMKKSSRIVEQLP
jgi:hypothetical protein